jgi:hypothetical protein
MSEEQSRMTEEARRELVDAIRSDRIENATKYSQEFAAKHGLNPQTVRSSISRLRREFGMLKRPYRAGAPPESYAQHGAPFSPDFALSQSMINVIKGIPVVNAMTFLNAGEVTDPALARLGAAVLFRYETDDDFRRVVDQQRPEIENIFQRVNELRAMTGELSAEEHQELLRFLQEP